MGCNNNVRVVRYEISLLRIIVAILLYNLERRRCHHLNNGVLNVRLNMAVIITDMKIIVMMELKTSIATTITIYVGKSQRKT